MFEPAMISKSDTLRIVIFCDEQRCFALIQSAVPRPPVRYALDFDEVARLTERLVTDDPAAYATRAVAHALFQRLLPDPIADFLRRSNVEHLVLQLDATLISLPWESLYDGASYFATRFHIAIQLLTDDPTSAAAGPSTDGALSVLQMHHRPSEPALHAEDYVPISRHATSHMRAGAVLEAAEKFTVLHYIGPFDGGWALEDGTLRMETLFERKGPLALVISEFDHVTAACRQAVREATRFNPRVPHIVCAEPVSAAARALFSRTLYRELQNGQTIGHAVTEARRNLLAAGLCGWSAYRLHGDPTARIVAGSALERTAQPGNPPAAELRQLTVLFCDLVGSTPASEGLDVEEWDCIQKLYNQTATQTVHRHGGVVHQYKGDGLVVYFGYPLAYEDAAARAVHAALEIVNELEHGCADAREMLRLRDRGPLAMRVGIHTGPVVVEDISGNATATGLTVAFCERIHRVAPENGVVISTATRALVAAHFHLRSFGRHILKGIKAPAECFLVEGARESHNVVLSDSAAKLTPFCGRQREVRELQDIWHDVKRGRACTVLLSGEAGIGKSRLLREFRDFVAAGEALVIGCSCSAYFQNHALYPVVQGLRRMMQIDGSCEPAAQLDLLQRFVSTAPDAATALPALASLLDIGMDARAAPLSGTADQQKAAIIDSLITWIEVIAKQQPVLLWAEDVHWIDATTLDYLTRLATDLSGAPIMTILTFRPDSGFVFEPGADRVHSVALSPIAPESARAMIAGTPGCARLPVKLVDRIVERTDGVPLFIEESTRMAMEVLRAPSAAHGEVRDSDLELQIPSTLQGLLTARLDRLGNAKYAAQVGSVIGRTFSVDLLEAAAEVDSKLLVSQLGALTTTGLMKAYVDDAGTILYSFKHALVRDTAYSSLLTARRRQLHGRVAAALEQRDYRSRSEGAELLAYHYAQSDQIPLAIECWMLAAQRAMRSAAQREAIGHLDNVLQAIRHGDRACADAKTELRAELMRAACLTAVAGYSASEAGEAFQCAERLAIEQQDDDALLRARLGIEAFHLMRADFERALQVAYECKRMTQDEVASPGHAAVPSRRLRHQAVNSATADWTIGNVLFHQAQFAVAIPYMDRCIERCTSVAEAERRQVQDPAVMCWIYKGWHAWEAGFPDRALEHVDAGIAAAYRAGHPFGIGVALAFRACIRFFRREYLLAADAARRSIEYSAEPSFRIWWAWARVLLGRSLSEQPSTRAEGIHEIREGLRMWDDSEAIVTRPFNLALLAEAYHADGRTAEALELLQVADQTIQRHGERYYEPEVKRLQGVMRADLARDVGDRRAARRHLDDAAAIARHQGMPSSELRALCDRVRLYPREADVELFRQRLGQLYAGFEEGHTTADLCAARGLLERARARTRSGKTSSAKGRC